MTKMVRCKVKPGRKHSFIDPDTKKRVTATGGDTVTVSLLQASRFENNLITLDAAKLEADLRAAEDDSVKTDEDPDDTEEEKEEKKSILEKAKDLVS